MSVTWIQLLNDCKLYFSFYSAFLNKITMVMILIYRDFQQKLQQHPVSNLRADVKQIKRRLFFFFFGLQFEIRQLRAHLAQQDLDLAAEREAAMEIRHVWGKQGRSFKVLEGLTPGESDDEGSHRTPREPSSTAGTVQLLNHYYLIIIIIRQRLYSICL